MQGLQIASFISQIKQFDHYFNHSLRQLFRISRLKSSSSRKLFKNIPDIYNLFCFI
jgi:hypothetical protein